MKRMLIVGIVAGALAVLPGAVAFADSTGVPGQPSQSCQASIGETGPFTPRGFNTAGFAHAETVYAGSQPQTSNNPKRVSQYDVACFQAASHQR